MSTPSVPDAVVENLRLLAAQSDVQRDVFPRGVHLADEIALSFHDVLVTWDPATRVDSVEAIYALDARLDAMSGPEQHALWTDEALERASEWAGVRKEAAEILDRLGYGWRKPDPKGLNFFIDLD